MKSNLIKEIKQYLDQKNIDIKKEIKDLKETSIDNRYCIEVCFKSVLNNKVKFHYKYMNNISILNNIYFSKVSELKIFKKKNEEFYKSNYKNMKQYHSYKIISISEFQNKKIKKLISIIQTNNDLFQMVEKLDIRKLKVFKDYFKK